MNVVHRDLKRMTKAILDDYELQGSAWRRTIPLVQSALNTMFLRQLDEKSSQKCFTEKEMVDAVKCILS